VLVLVLVLEESGKVGREAGKEWEQDEALLRWP